MPTKPRIATLTNSSVDVLNAIRNSATTEFKNYVPIATNDAESIRTIGAILMDYPTLLNEFSNALVNRIGRVILSSVMFTNPLSLLKKGRLELGETIEEIFVELAKPFQFDMDMAGKKVDARVTPDIRTAFHPMNYQTFYKQTISDAEWRLAFTSPQGVTDLIAKVVESMRSAAEYDEFLVTKYLMARSILNGHIVPVTVPTVSAENASDIVTVVKNTSNSLSFPSPDYNIAGVRNHAPKNRQYVILSGAFDAIMDVNVLATAFHADKADFMGRRLMIDSFGSLDPERLAELFENDSTYVPITEAEMSALNTIPAIIVGEDWFMIFDKQDTLNSRFNEEGLFTNYWYHVWKVFSISPFANAALMVPGTPTVTSVTVSPSAVTASAGQSVSLAPTVVTSYFAPKTVVWTSSNPGVHVNAAGIVTIGSDVESGTSVSITATSTFDNSKSNYATLTVG